MTQVSKLALLLLIVVCLPSMALASPEVKNWSEPTPPMRLDYGYDQFDYQTTFWELKPGRLAPINTKTAVGVPGWPVIGFGYLMRVRYSEFEMRFQTTGEKFIHTLPNFKQVCPGDWLPGAVTSWDKAGVNYNVSYICAPNDPQPVDLYRITLKNTSSAKVKGDLQVELNGSPTLKADGDLIADRGKPLIIMDPPVPVERFARDAGVLDPRCTAAGTWRNGSPECDEWATHRDGWYGMPIEYVLKSESPRSLQVFLGFDGTPPASTPNWDVPLNQEFPEVVDLYLSPDREIIAKVEGDADPQRIKLPGTKRIALKFPGRDTDGDGYISISVQAAPESRQPACLAMLWAFDENSKVSVDDLLTVRRDVQIERKSQEMYDVAKKASDRVKEAKYRIDVGDDLMWDVNREWSHSGNDPTLYGLRLSYDPDLAPGEEKTYTLRLPAIDKPEAAPYGNAIRPYDTPGGSWKPYMDARHPENKAPYGEDVPVGVDPAQFAAFGPKSHDIWNKQLAAAKNLSWQAATDRLSSYWENYLANRAKFLMPEPLIDSLYRHQLAVLKLHQITFTPTDYRFQLTGPDWYWDIAISRDVPYMYYAYDWAGLKNESDALWRTMLAPLSKVPRSRWTVGEWEGKPERDGMWITRTGQWDAQGQVLWGLSNHYFLTGDRKWLDENYKDIARGADWILRAVEREKKALGNPDAIGYGMLPPSTPEGGGPGHNYYASSFAILGLKSTAKLSDVMGKPDDAKRYRAQAAETEVALHKAIRAGFFTFNDFAGTIPFGPEWLPNAPHLMTEKDGRKYCTILPDTNFGCPLVWPTEAVAPMDPLMNAWCRNREHLAEKSGGIFEWPYIAVDYGLSYIRRGEPDRAADWFYVYVDDASGCLDWGEGCAVNAVFPEFDPPKKGIRTGGQMPHGWASALYVSYLRNIMLNEEDSALHLAPATPRKWLAQTAPIGVEKAPSQFGDVTYHLIADPDRVTIRGDVELDPKRKPERLLVHVRAPGGRGLYSVTVNGKKWDAYAADTIIIANPPSKIAVVAKYRN